MQYPKIVYKYRSWEDTFHKNLLLKNQLYLASPKQFNDPFDCGIPINFLLLDNIKKIKEYANQVITRQKHNLLLNGRNPEDEREFIVSTLLNDLEGFQQRQEDRNIHNRNTFYGVLALSERWDSILMWSHYGKDHKGYCVGFHEPKLRESGKFGKGGKVIYDDEMPKIDPRESFGIESSFIETHYKSKDWSYEKEYRLMKNLFDDNSESNRTVNVQDDCFCEGMKH